jgi:ABC-2 type transport system permease protein
VSRYLAVFRMRMLRGLRYRTAALAGIATQFAWGLLLIMVLGAFARAGASPMTGSQIASYIWLQQAFLAFVMLWFRDGELFSLIVSGDAAYELCRPVDLYSYWYARLLAQRVAAAGLRCLPILAVAAFLPEPLRLLPPASLEAGLLFLPCLALGLLVLVAISFFTYLLAFVTLSPLASILMIGPLGEFCSGMVIPIPMMPQWTQSILSVLPFRLAADLPFRVYSGSIDVPGALQGLGLQAVWLLALVALGRMALARVLKRFAIPGG